MNDSTLHHRQRPLVTAAAAIAAQLLLLTSACDGDRATDGLEATEASEPLEAETLRFSKTLVVSDGTNEVELVVASENEALLERYDDDSFEITPLFERPAGFEAPEADADADEAGQLVPPRDFSDSVLLEEGASLLEEGAIGYQLRWVDDGFRDALACASPNVYTSPRDFARVENTGGICTEVKISTKKYSWSWYTEKAHLPMLCAGQDVDAGKSSTNRVKAEVCPGPSYTINFHN